MSIRLKNIECSNTQCNNLFDYTVEIPENHIFSVYCPFCSSETVLDLNPNRKQEDTVFRGGTKTQSKLSNEYDLPEKLQGTKPKG